MRSFYHNKTSKCKLHDGNIYKYQLKSLKFQHFVSFSLNPLLFVYNFAVISYVMPNIALNYSDCHLPAEIVEVCMFGSDMDRCSVNLVVIPQTLENKY